MRPFRYAALLLICCASLLSAQVFAHPRDREIHDPDTLAWWHTTEALSGDAMEGRDTGSPAYQRAADYVAARFKSAGLQPAGENGGYFQTVPLHEVALDPAGTSFMFEPAPSGIPPGGAGAGPLLHLAFLREISLPAALYLHDTTAGPLTFRGYCGSGDLKDVTGKFVICFGARNPKAPTTAAQRSANVRASGAAGMLNLDDPSFTIEPARWPDAYSRSVTLQGTATARSQPQAFLTMRLSYDGLKKLLAGSAHDAATLVVAGSKQQPLSSFDLPGSFRVQVKSTEREISSPNILAVLPGSDPTLANQNAQYVVVGAHLDGYGFGTPVAGDKLYNGTLDDAAYVALLIQMADDLKAGKLPRPKRSILFCVFTGEEKGLLGSHWFVSHPTVPIAGMAADINLDQLRPLFPLKILTAPGINLTSLGQTATEVGKSMNIELRDDREPERGLLRRADNFPFLQAGVPAIGFIFGYDPRTDEERRYRHWYDVQYHRPQDDLTQPMDFDAARKFDTFFYTLVGTVADAPERPKILEPVRR